ncbi:MAG: aminotransferase class IV [Thermodesulfovibrionales bacterium]|nr:aminotransferase class IV [Thermodesulfovibrionales bacterium]
MIDLSSIPWRTLLYGEGVFETILWRGKTEKLLRHYRRLRNSADFLKIPCPSFEEFFEKIERETGGKRDLYVKFCLFSSGDTRYDVLPDNYKIMVIVKPYRRLKNVRLTLSPFRRNSRDPLVYHKTINYLFNILVKRKAVTEGFDDAVILNERDEVTECSSSNIIIIKDGIFMTPAIECGLLRGTTLSALMERFDIKEVRAGIQELMDADFLIITNSISGAVPVTGFMDIEFPVAHEIIDEFNRIIEEENREWS